MDGKDQLDDRVWNEEELQTVMEEMNILRTIKRSKTKWIGHILRRFCLLKHVTEEKMYKYVMGRWRRRRTRILDGLR